MRPDDIPKEESVERPWASNDKVQFDNVITHCKALMGYSELAMKQAVEFQQKSNDAYLSDRDRREQQRLEHDDERESHRLENNRYTLDRLYSVFPEEAAGLVSLLKATLQILEGGEQKK